MTNPVKYLSNRARFSARVISFKKGMLEIVRESISVKRTYGDADSGS